MTVLLQQKEKLGHGIWRCCRPRWNLDGCGCFLFRCCWIVSWRELVQSILSILSCVMTEASRFPIHQIYCVRQNYLEHAIEMGGNWTHDPPWFISKSPNAATNTCTTDNNWCIINYPPMTNNLHHEIELVVAIRTPGQNISKHDAKQHIFRYAIGYDLMCHDLKAKAKEWRQP